MLFQGRAKNLIKRASGKSPNSLESMIYANKGEYTWTTITEAVLSHSEPIRNHLLHKYAP